MINDPTTWLYPTGLLLNTLKLEKWLTFYKRCFQLYVREKDFKHFDSNYIFPMDQVKINGEGFIVRAKPSPKPKHYLNQEWPLRAIKHHWLGEVDQHPHPLTRRYLRYKISTPSAENGSFTILAWLKHKEMLWHSRIFFQKIDTFEMRMWWL